MLELLALAILALIAYAIYNAYKSLNSLMPENSEAVWRHFFPDLKFSALEFYDAIEKKLREQEVSEITTLRVQFSEHGEILDRNRTYLRVRSGRFVFDICAAPYGTGFFASSWLGEDVTLLMRILFRVPLIGGYFKRRVFNKTYYVRDSQAMFQEVTHRAVMLTVDEITNQKGVRALSETERRPRSVRG